MSESKETQLKVEVHFEGNHFWAEVEDLPGCFATGSTLDELREALEEAIGMYLSEQPGDCRVHIVDFSPPPAAVKHVPVRAELIPA